MTANLLAFEEYFRRSSMVSQINSVTGIARALKFAAGKHRLQKRKDHQTPYINHPIEVLQILSTVGGVTDNDILIAAVLHDTLEDTETTPEEIEKEFGQRVLELVKEVSDD